jgi:hypothetical protein
MGSCVADVDLDFEETFHTGRSWQADPFRIFRDVTDCQNWSAPSPFRSRPRDFPLGNKSDIFHSATFKTTSLAAVTNGPDFILM